MSQRFVPDADSAQRYAERVEPSAGNREAIQIVRLFDELSCRIEDYIAEHGRECACAFCAEPDEWGRRAGVALVRVFRQMTLTLDLYRGLAGDDTIGSGDDEEEDDDAPGPDDADEPLAVVTAAR